MHEHLIRTFMHEKLYITQSVHCTRTVLYDAHFYCKTVGVFRLTILRAKKVVRTIPYEYDLQMGEGILIPNIRR